MTSVDWTYGVNYVASRQFTSGCDYCFPRRQSIGMRGAPDFAAGLDDCRAARTMDRAIDSAASEQSRIRGVNDRIDVLADNVADRNNYSTGEKVLFKWGVQDLVLE